MTWNTPTPYFVKLRGVKSSAQGAAGHVNALRRLAIIAASQWPPQLQEAPDGGPIPNSF